MAKSFTLFYEKRLPTAAVGNRLLALELLRAGIFFSRSKIFFRHARKNFPQGGTVGSISHS